MTAKAGVRGADDWAMDETRQAEAVKNLRAWLASVNAKFKLPPDWQQAIDALDRRLVNQPDKVTAVDVARIFQPLEKQRIVTPATPGAHRALQYLIEHDQIGPFDSAPLELRGWMRKHYMWASNTTSVEVDVLSTDVGEAAFRKYFDKS